MLPCPVVWGEQQVVIGLGMYPVSNERSCLMSLLPSLPSVLSLGWCIGPETLPPTSWASLSVTCCCTWLSTSS